VTSIGGRSSDGERSRRRDGEFLAPVGEVRFEVREKGSRFLGVLCPAADEEEVEIRLSDLRSEYPDATHHCWAYRLGWPARERSSDDGEPAGTAGTPILRVLAGREISNVLVVVVRWFGGVKLGKGGLARAYGGTARAAIEAGRFSKRFPTVVVSISVPYERLGAVKRLLRPPLVELETATYGARVGLDLRIAEAVLEETEMALANLGIVPESGDLGP
jgi:uncharacterized YigZ family protein